jgi:hypothetical protein
MSFDAGSILRQIACVGATPAGAGNKAYWDKIELVNTSWATPNIWYWDGYIWQQINNGVGG